MSRPVFASFEDLRQVAARGVAAEPTRPGVLLLYGLDEASPEWEVSTTLPMIEQAAGALQSRGWHVRAANAGPGPAEALAPFDPRAWVVLNLCEGSPAQACSYARVARLLEARGFAYTGSRAPTLHRTQFKWILKRQLEAAGVPTPRWTLAGPRDPVAFDRLPAIVKPAALHCSVGITRDSVVRDEAEARRQVERVRREHGGAVLVEEFLDGPEYNVSLWGDGAPEVLGISSMRYDAFPDVRDRLCTFDAKWTPDSDAYRLIPVLCPAPLTPAQAEDLSQAALGAYRATQCRDYARVDLRLDRHGRARAFDVNPNCDLSSDGGLCNTARAAGLGYADVLDRVVRLALGRMARA